MGERGASIPMPMHDSNSKLVFSSEDDDFFDAEDENSIMEEEEEDEVEEEEEKSIVQRIPEIQKGIFFQKKSMLTAFENFKNNTTFS